MEMEKDSFSSLSSTSTLSCDPLIVGGSAHLESGLFTFPPSTTRTTTTTSALSFSDANPYAGTASSLGARNRRWPHRRFFHEASDFDLKPQHFLDSCFLCKKPLSGNRDIFMYRGDLPFCSEECRQQQIEMDEEQESAKAAALRALSRRELQLQKEEPRSSPKADKARAGSIQLAG